MSVDRLVDHPNVEVVATDLRALLFWAGVGVSQSVDGQYSEEIEEIIRSYSAHLHLPTWPKVRFRKVHVAIKEASTSSR